MVKNSPKQNISRRAVLAFIGAGGVSGLSGVFGKKAWAMGTGSKESIVSILDNIDENKEFYTSFWKNHSPHFRERLQNFFAKEDASHVVWARELVSWLERVLSRADTFSFFSYAIARSGEPPSFLGFRFTIGDEEYTVRGFPGRGSAL